MAKRGRKPNNYQNIETTEDTTEDTIEDVILDSAEEVADEIVDNVDVPKLKKIELPKKSYRVYFRNGGFAEIKKHALAQMYINKSKKMNSPVLKVDEI